MPPWYVFVIIGVLGGISAGFFGIGGGIVIVPALNLLGRFLSAHGNGNEHCGAASAHRSRRSSVSSLASLFAALARTLCMVLASARLALNG